MKISLIHPSRGRAQKAKSTYDFWMQNSSGNIEIEHILSIDSSEDYETSKKHYYNLFDHLRDNKYSKLTWLLLTYENTCVVEAANHAAKYATGDILVYLSDDFKCPKNWDELIVSEFWITDPHFLRANVVFGEKSPMLLKVDDCLQKFNRPVVTIPIMNKELYKILGYFFNPLYKSMFCDNDLFCICKINRWLVEAPELKFPHEHHSVGKAEMDETYRKSEANYKEGKEIFEQRKLAGFPL